MEWNDVLRKNHLKRRTHLVKLDVFTIGKFRISKRKKYKKCFREARRGILNENVDN